MRSISPPIQSFGFLALFAAAVLAENPAAPPSTQKDDTVVVKRGDLSLVVTAEGWFEPIDPLEVRFRPKSFQGELKIESLVPHGSPVKAGELVLKVKDDEIARQIAAAENELALAQANLVKAEADVKLGGEGDELAMKMQNESLAAAENNVKWWEKVDGPQQLKRIELENKQYSDAVEDQQDELDQLRKMYKSEELTNATADIVVKRAVRQLERVQTVLGMTKERGEKTKATEYEESRRRVDNALEQQKQAMSALQVSQAQAKVGRAAALFSAKAAYEAANRKAGDLRADFATFAVGAPGDGVAYYGTLAGGNWQNSSPRSLRQGDKLAPDQVVMTIVDPKAMCIVAAVPENQIGRLKKGDSAVISPKAFPELQLKGTCKSIAPTATMAGEAPKYEVRIALESVDPKLQPGQKASVKIDIEDAKAAVLIPATAVADGKVCVPGEGKAKTREVIVGRSDGEMVEVISGLNEGDKVLATFKKD